MSNTFIYAIHCPNKGEVKIGYATNPIARLSQLQVGTTDRLDILLTFPGGLVEEKDLHNLLRNYKISGEWFLASIEVLNIIYTFSKSLLPQGIYTLEERSNQEKVEYVKRITEGLKKKRYPLSEISKLVPDISKKQLKETLLSLGWEPIRSSSNNIYYRTPLPST